MISVTKCNKIVEKIKVSKKSADNVYVRIKRKEGLLCQWR